MGSSETATFNVVVNGGMAQKSLNEVRASALGLGGGLESVVGGLDKIGGKSGADAEKATRALGFAMGSAGGRASELLGVVGDIAGALSGGGLAIGLTAAAAAGTYAWTKYEEALAEVASASTAADEQVKRILANFTDASNARLASAAASAQQLADAVNSFGKSPQQMALENIVGKQIENEEKLIKLRVRRNQLETDRIPNATTSRVLNGEIDELERARAVLEKQVTEAQANFDKLRALAGGKRREDEANARARKEVDERRAIAEATFGDVNDLLAGVLGDRAKLEDEEARAREALRKQDEEFARNHAETLIAIEADRKTYAIRIAEEEADKKEQLRQQEEQRVQGYATQAVGILAGASADLISNLVKGQQDALAVFASSVFQQAGTALIGHGIDAAGGGIAQLALSGGALGGQALATGLGLIGAGGILGGVGAGIESQLTGLGGGAAGPTAALGPAREPGVNFGPSSSGAPAAAAPVTYVFNYGVGPAPEKMARDLAKAQRYGQAHRIIPRDGR